MPSCVCFSDMCLHSKPSKTGTTETGGKRDHFGKCADVCSLIIPEYITSKLFLLPSGSEYTKVYPSRAFGFFFSFCGWGTERQCSQTSGLGQA